MEKLIQSITTRTKLSPNTIKHMQDYFIKEEVPKNTLVLSDGQTCRKLYFLERGTLRTFYYHMERDITSWFYKEGNFMSSWYSFYNQQPGFEYIETLEDTVFWSVSHQKYQQLLQASFEFQQFGRLLAEEQVAFIDYYSKGYMFLSAREKYNLLIEYFPDIELRVKLGHIASYLGISQETLSRIRAGKQ
ncbi:hypothetical protein BKI52_19880 [marine bacterium AO1-C]|nr:hypothetical protein BKI52_19880 [marine bacterium AO1-C]